MIRRDEPEFVAERDLIALHPDGTATPFVVRIGKPFSELDGECWACPVELDGLEPRRADVRGIDAFQALSLAISLAKARLEDHASRGIQFRWTDGEPASIESLLS